MGNSKPFTEGQYHPDSGSGGIGLRNAGINNEVAATLAKNVVAAAVTGGAGPYNLTSTANRALNVYFSQDNGSTYKRISFTGIVGPTPAATTSAQIAALLNANVLFANFFTAVDNAGTLTITRKLPSARFKVYFTGTLAAVLGVDFTTAIAPGSALAGGTNAGLPFEFTVQDQEGNALANVPVYLSCYDDAAGTNILATTGLGLFSKGDLSGAQAQNTAALAMTDQDGKVAGYITDTANEIVYLHARPLNNTSRMAKVLSGQKVLTFT